MHEGINVFGPFSTLTLVSYGLAISTNRKTTMVRYLLSFMYVHVFQKVHTNSGWQHLTSERHGRLFSNISLRAGGQMLQTRVANLTPSNAGGTQFFVCGGSYRPYRCGNVIEWVWQWKSGFSFIKIWVDASKVTWFGSTHIYYRIHRYHFPL